MAGRSSSTVGILMPWAFRPSRASAKSSEEWSRAFEGMQPMFRQVPPSDVRRSTQATFMPSWAARMAAT
jgi:hypothetical protein